MTKGCDVTLKQPWNYKCLYPYYWGITVLKKTHTHTHNLTDKQRHWTWVHSIGYTGWGVVCPVKEAAVKMRLEEGWWYSRFSLSSKPMKRLT